MGIFLSEDNDIIGSEFTPKPKTYTEEEVLLIMAKMDDNKSPKLTYISLLKDICKKYSIK